MSRVESTVFIVDDEEPLRESLHGLLETLSLNVRTFASGQEFLASYEPDWHGCALLDLLMPVVGGMRLQAELKRRGSLLSVIFLTAHGDIPTAVEALQNGALDFLEKPVRAPILIEKIQRALERSEQLRQRRARLADIEDRLTLLTPREKEILALIKDGVRAKQISYNYKLSRKTIDGHLTSIREKLGVETTLQMITLLCESDYLRSSCR
jgi:two-component system response regulator FixJ